MYPMASYFLFLDNINDNHGEASKELGKIGGRLNDNDSSKNTTKGKLQPYKPLHERLVRKIAAIKRGIQWRSKVLEPFRYLAVSTILKEAVYARKIRRSY